MKTAAMGGQDLRLPVMGGTKFPTDDSKGGPQGLLSKSMSSAEKGPSPTMGQLAPTGPTVPKITGQPQGVMPKTGGDMTLQNDPLIQYLKKQAGLVGTNSMEDNHDNMPTGPEETELSTAPPQPTKDNEQESMGTWTGYLKAQFDNSKGLAPKYIQKDQPPEPGKVDQLKDSDVIPDLIGKPKLAGAARILDIVRNR